MQLGNKIYFQIIFIIQIHFTLHYNYILMLSLNLIQAPIHPHIFIPIHSTSLLTYTCHECTTRKFVLNLHKVRTQDIQSILRKQ